MFANNTNIDSKNMDYRNLPVSNGTSSKFAIEGIAIISTS
jgi:hypothetical protein